MVCSMFNLHSKSAVSFNDVLCFSRLPLLSTRMTSQLFIKTVNFCQYYLNQNLDSRLVDYLYLRTYQLYILEAYTVNTV